MNNTLRLIDGNNLFRRLFEKLGPVAMPTLYQESISNLPTQTIAWVWDGRNSKARRRAIFPDYKEGRAPASDEFYRSREFFKELLGHSNCLNIECEGWEADDVIATMAKGFEGDVLINSNDADFLTLTSKPNIRVLHEKEFDVPAEDMRLFKALVGDQSDNIKGIKGYGVSKFKKLTALEKNLFIDALEGKRDPEEVAEALALTPAVKANWIENIETIRKGWQIIELYDVPLDELGAGIKVGQLNPTAAQQRLAALYIPTEPMPGADVVARLRAEQAMMNHAM
ncbi:hypothetical protein [Photobacterium sp. GSS17]|uniref:hypothetical protein n=1 Tax=Photobacterium sp. GSS17 TaxID=3020715 RepID=UPI00235DF418|nr:hypothetical protein [Photobacterium sp. GSS17]